MDREKSGRHSSIDLQFRIATIEDLDNIQYLTNWAILHTTANLDLEPTSNEQMKAWLSHHNSAYPVWILESDDDFAGWASISPFSPKTGYKRMVENSVYILPEFQGKGFGSTCLEWLIEEAGKLGYRQMIAKITAENKISINLHLRKGFVETGRLVEAAEKFNKILDVVILQKKLGEA